MFKSGERIVAGCDIIADMRDMKISRTIWLIGYVVVTEVHSSGCIWHTVSIGNCN